MTFAMLIEALGLGILPPGAGQRWREAVFSQEPAKRWSGLPIGRTGGHLNQSEVLLPAHYSSDMEPFTPCADASVLHFS